MIDIDHLRQWIGRRESKAEVASPSLVERFAATFDHPANLSEGAIAPAMIHLCLAPPVVPTAELGLDGHPTRGGFLPPVALPRRMWAGGAMTFQGDIRVGELVTRHSTIRDVTIKQGRSGTLCFVTVDHVIDSAGRHVLTERQDIVYRDVDGREGEAANAPPTAAHGDHRMRVTPTTALLFRYSALTFNAHRIHYDNPYMRQNEGYPGLIVHGPMQATMLVQLAEKIRGSRPAQFEFRSLSPLFDIADFTLNAVEDGDGLKLWTSYIDGPVAMEARAIW